jgi:hypothetical protein
MPPIAKPPLTKLSRSVETRMLALRACFVLAGALPRPSIFVPATIAERYVERSWGGSVDALARAADPQRASFHRLKGVSLRQRSEET